jgi:hypothetical protein
MYVEAEEEEEEEEEEEKTAPQLLPEVSFWFPLHA